jgi:hypothetical protein
MKAARVTDEGGAGGNFGGGSAAAAAHQATMEQYDDRVECKWCNRKFNEEAANRHIPLCEKKYKENQMKGKGGAAAKGGANKTAVGFKR